MTDEDLIVAGLQPPYNTEFEVLVGRFKSSDEGSSLGWVPGFSFVTTAGSRKLNGPQEGETRIQAVIKQLREEIQYDLEMMILQNLRLKKQYDRYGLGFMSLLPLDDEKFIHNTGIIVRYAKVTSENPNWKSC